MTRTLLVASAGGHLDELIIHARRLGVDQEQAVWVTSPTPQTEYVLKDREVVWVPRVGSGQVSKAVLGLPRALDIHRRVRPRLVVSTGALFATPHLLAATVARCETWYIDSATRIKAPSSTGRFAQRFTTARLYTQSPGWDSSRWTRVPSVFDAFEAVPRSAPANIQRVTVSLGSEVWPFARAITKVRALLPDAEVCWQVGNTEYEADGALLPRWVSPLTLRSDIRDSDVVIMHAGVGSVLVALDEGHVPVILPRRMAHGEMVDDHQTEVAALLAERNLAISVDPDCLTHEHLARAASLGARRRATVEDHSP